MSLILDGTTGVTFPAGGLGNTAGAAVGTTDTQTLTNKDIVATQLTGDIAAARITNALNASGSAPIFAARAWVNFNGTGTVAIRASGNVSSITDNGVGSYTLNFTTALDDTNYSFVGTARATATVYMFVCPVLAAPKATTSLRVSVNTQGFAAGDSSEVNVAVFR